MRKIIGSEIFGGARRTVGNQETWGPGNSLSINDITTLQYHVP